MATLNLINSTTGEEYEVPGIEFAEVTPKDILGSEDLGLPAPPAGQKWNLLRGSQVVDENTTLEKLGFQDGDKAQIMAKVQGA
ncbi:hypothetical protein [Bergeyella zoohelcum]|uniref:Ubiquitin-like domain-containing protein n=1 Tax=Bergeyella zoohelcum TaxID=1015 RepID=A0A7Z9CH23_9FLAO|nr:hypothetical protein [Bergeyella zoohelcum]VDH04159.1 Uncharacterised protein [Bergeyella zoohelcum]